MFVNLQKDSPFSFFFSFFGRTYLGVFLPSKYQDVFLPSLLSSMWLNVPTLE